MADPRKNIGATNEPGGYDCLRMTTEITGLVQFFEVLCTFQHVFANEIFEMFIG